MTNASPTSLHASDPSEDRAAATRQFAQLLAQDYASESAAPLSETWRDVWQACAGFGLLSLAMPEAHGGVTASALETVEIMEAFGYGYPDNGLTMGLNSQLWTVQQVLQHFGSDAQQTRYLPGLIHGRSIASFALTEADAGSDAMRLATTATPTPDGYVLNGDKRYIGMATACDVALVFASTAPDRGSWGISAFLVERSDVGFEQGPVEAKHGLTTLPFGSMRFQDCHVPKDRLLGSEGSGARIFQTVMDWERSFILATHVGAMRRQVDDCAAFSDTREVFGQAIGGFQSVSNRLADMRLRLETAQLMLHKAARLMDDGKLTSLHAAMTNLHISEAFLASSIDAVRTFGGAGYMARAQSGMDVRDALGGVLYSGTSDIQRQIIARMIDPAVDT
jgi:alkylation response protein AidB-like acyl-CoA dehydrogenase